MNIFSAKYKAHRLVNYIFYIVVFVFGFLVGFGAKKFDFKSAISKLFLIDNVYAFNSSSLNEEIIYNKFKTAWPNFSIEDYPYINCFTSLSTSAPLTCVAVDEQTHNSLYAGSAFSSENTRVQIRGYSGHDIYRLVFNSDLSINLYQITNTSNYTTSIWSGGHYIWTNFDYSSIINNSTDLSYSQKNAKKNSISSSTNSTFIPLDFSPYMIPEMVYDDSLFDDDSNFKKVCVNNYDTFSITSNEIQDYDTNNNPLYHSFDFIWFKDGVKGLSTWLYDSETETHVTLFQQQQDGYLSDPYGWYFWLNSADEINTYWNSPNSPGLELITKGYTYNNRYNYFNYTFYPFQIWFTTEYHRYQVFWFKDPYIQYLDDSIIRDNKKYCFYIKNEYDVNILNKNENGDVYSNYNALGDTPFTDQTFKNELEKDTEGFFSSISNFISSIRPTINFINTNIFNLYSSMPLLLRMFILSLITLIVVKILLGMVIK